MASISTTQAQNLVYNGSFEEYSECPQGNELNNGQFERATGWWIPTDSSPDYFNQCNNGIVSVPENFWGYQQAFHGKAYVGFIPVMNDNKLLYEYFRTKLTLPLKPCVKYNFRMYVALANYSTHGFKKIGAYFSKENNSQTNADVLNVNPQIKFHGNPVIDTTNWTLIEGTFIAKGNEQFLTIGYFEQDINDDTVFVQEIGNFYLHPYYYVDSVSLIEIGTVPDELCDVGEIIFPNIITANNDGVNDQIDATEYFHFTDEIVIMNRWGNVVSILTNDNPIWKGSTASGRSCTEGTYFYSFTYKWGDEQKEKSGFIQLVR